MLFKNGFLRLPFEKKRNIYTLLTQDVLMNIFFRNFYQKASNTTNTTKLLNGTL